MYHNISEKGCALYTKLGSIHYLKGLNKGRVLHAGASYTRKITVVEYKRQHDRKKSYFCS